MGIMVTSGGLCGIMVAHWPGMPEMLVPNFALGTIFPIFTGCHDRDPVQATCCMVVEPTLCMCMYGPCLYVCNCKH